MNNQEQALIDAFNKSLSAEQGKALVSMLDPSQKILFLEILQSAKNEARLRVFVDWAKERVVYCKLRRNELHAAEAAATGRVDRAVEIACYETEAATLADALKRLGTAP